MCMHWIRQRIRVLECQQPFQVLDILGIGRLFAPVSSKLHGVEPLLHQAQHPQSRSPSSTALGKAEKKDMLVTSSSWTRVWGSMDKDIFNAADVGYFFHREDSSCPRSL